MSVVICDSNRTNNADGKSKLMVFVYLILNIPLCEVVAVVVVVTKQTLSHYPCMYRRASGRVFVIIMAFSKMHFYSITAFDEV